MLTIRSNDGREIHSFSQWECWGLPESRRHLHWKEGRSAYELGREWTLGGDTATPPCIDRMFDTNPATRGLVLKSGVTELETTLPFGSRGARCHDLVLWGVRGDARMLVCVEAKADEPFGGSLTSELQRARKRPVTRFPNRLQWLTSSLLGVPAFLDSRLQMLDPAVAHLPYQLLTAIAGTLLEAQHQHVHGAVLLIHEFKTHATLDENLEQNARRLTDFLRVFLAAHQFECPELSLNLARIIGPLQIKHPNLCAQPGIPTNIPLFLGKIRSDHTIPG